MLTKRLNAMEVADVLVADGLAAFLVETRPKAFLSFTKVPAKGHDMDAIVKKTLGADDVAMLARVLRRWLAENQLSVPRTSLAAGHGGTRIGGGTKRVGAPGAANSRV